MTDIDIPKSPTRLLKKIDSHKINDELIGSSMNYLEVNDSYANVRDRIYGLQYLKEYINSRTDYFGIRSYWLYKSCVDTKTNTESVMLDKLKNGLEKQKE